MLPPHYHSRYHSMERQRARSPMPPEHQRKGEAIGLADGHRQGLAGFLGRHDLFYIVPTAIAVAAFIVAMLAYFDGAR